MNPYAIIKNRRVTEKTSVLAGLEKATGPKSLTRCKTPKVVFDVDIKANKAEIKRAIETIYPKVKVTAVNTLIAKPKSRRVRGHEGMTSAFKKAVVSLRPGDAIDEQV